MRNKYAWFAAGLLMGAVAIPVHGAVILNEILANNANLDVNGRTPDWIEVYNTGDTAVDLGGMSLSSEPATANRWAFRAGTLLSAHGFFVVLCDDARVPSDQNTGFGLGASGDSVYLFNAAGIKVDSVTFGLQATDFSIGRTESSATAWRLMIPTRGAANQPATLGNQYGLRINEWMADPESGKAWFELYNPDANPVMLQGLYLTDNSNKPLKNPIPDLSFIGVGTYAFEKFIADGSSTNGANHVNFKLANDGEEIGVFTASGPIHRLVYGPQSVGISQGYAPDGSSTVVSFVETPTPGESNYLPLKNVVINEILSHSDAPLEDAVELYNPTAADVAVGGWYLSDSPSLLKKYQIPAGTVVPGHGFAVFYEYQFGDTNLANAFFFNSSQGDTAYLSQADTAGNLTGVRTWQKFGASANGVSFGRFTNSLGDVEFVPMSGLSFGSTVQPGDPPAWTNLFVQGKGATNPYPLIGPVVISEIMYHPPAVVAEDDNVLDEYVELHNVTGTNTLLYTPTEYTNTWRLRGGIDFDFPTNVTIPAGGYLLLVSFDPSTNAARLATFRTKYSLPSLAQIFGPYSGKLGNNGDTLDLQKPDPIQGMTHPDAGFVPFVRVEQVEYLDSTAWPLGADQTGWSLQRSNDVRFGDDAANWFAAAPTAGRSNTGVVADQDKDGLPDDWELAHGLNPNDASDAALDSDGDGLTNSQEYLCGTDPRDATDVLRFSSIQRTTDGATLLEFKAMADKTYTVQFKDSSEQPDWAILTAVAAQSIDRPEQVQDTTLGSSRTRLYRLVVP